MFARCSGLSQQTFKVSYHDIGRYFREKEKMWRGAGKHYDNVKKILIRDSPVCSCVTDIENNGLMMYLEQIAETLEQQGKMLS